MKNTEIEYKYWADSVTPLEFESKVLNSSISKDQIRPTIYVVSCDDYWEKTTPPLPIKRSFVRHRKSNHKQELTVKSKEIDNVVRTEINIDVSSNSPNTVSDFLLFLGYEKSFQVYKEAWIWEFTDCDVSYYLLADGRGVIELEATSYSTYEEGIDIIKRYENALGLSFFAKEERSLYEIFSEEKLFN